MAMDREECERVMAQWDSGGKYESEPTRLTLALALRATLTREKAARDAIAEKVRAETDAQCFLVLRRTRLSSQEREWATAEIVREAVAAVKEAR